MLPPESTTTTGGTKSRGCSSSAATPAAPAGFDHLLGPLQAQQQPAGQALLRDRHHPPGVAGQDAERDVTRAADRDAVRHGGAGLHRHRMPGRQRARIRRDRLRLHADHLDLRVEALDRHRDAGREAAAAHRHHDRAHLRALLDDLEAERCPARPRCPGGRRGG